MNMDTKFYSLSFEKFVLLDARLQSKVFFDNKLIVLKSSKPLLSKKIKSLCLNFGKLYKNECGGNFFADNDAFVNACF